MRFHEFSICKHVFSKTFLVNAILIVNILVWYSYASVVLIQIVDTIASSPIDKLAFYAVSFFGAVIAIFVGVFAVSKFNNRRLFIILWTLISIISSALLAFLQIEIFLSTLIFSSLVNISFGLGFPICMALFAENTTLENRARSGSIILLITFLATFMIKFFITANLAVNSFVLIIWRVIGLLASLSYNIPQENPTKIIKVPFLSIISDRAFHLYLVPWIIFSSVNYLAWSIVTKFISEELIRMLAMIENIVSGLFALIAGLISDSFGRKRTLMIGFILFGLGYAILGIFPSSIISWYFYTIVDGICWGIIYVMFLFTIWGDIAQGRPCEKHYAVGVLPLSLAGFLHLSIGPTVAEIISPYAIFSLASFFLFLAVVPLMYAPETLPEKVVRERELRNYIEKAKRVREKFTKG